MRSMMRAALGLIVAVPLAAGRPDAAKLDVGGVPSLDGPAGAPILKQGLYTVLFTDTGANQYSLWSTTQRNIYAENDTIVACYRRLGDGSLGSGALGISWSVDGGVNWLTAWPVNEGINGDPAAGALGRYPHAVKDPLSPGCSWPELEPSPAWGFEGAAYTIDYTDPSQIFGAINGSVNDHVHKNDLYEINGIWWGVAHNENDTFFVVQFDPATATYTSIQPSQTLTGVMYPEAVKRGTDGSVVVFGQNAVSGNFGFAVLNTAAGDFDPIVDFGPDTTILGYDWLDGVYFGGNAMMVAAVYTDTSAALANELHGLYYDAATGTTTVFRLDDPATDPHYIHYPQVVTSADGQYVAVLWAQSQDTVMDAAVGGFHWDLWVNVSLDGGMTWYGPVNIGDPAVNEVMPHVNGFITSAGDLYFMFAVSADPTNFPNWDMYYETLAGSELVSPEYNFVKLNIFTPVEEERADVRAPARLAFDLRTQTLRLVASSGVSGEARVELLDVAGRVVRTIPVTLRNGTGSATFGSLTKGTYLIRASLPNGEQVNGKIWVAR